MEESIITPWEVKGKINYMQQIEHFGTSPITSELIERWERVTGTKAHRFLRRGLVFSHQDLELILDDVENGRPVYIYTGRGPSSESMHLGHLVPFILTKYLQDALNCLVVIQMSDDEKFLFKDGSTPKDLNYYRELSYKNAKDIIACGFDLEKTFIFSNLEYNSDDLYFNNVLIMKSTTMNQIKNTYGLGEILDQNIINLVKRELEKETDYEIIKSYQKVINNNEGKTESNNVGQCVWPCFQCGPAYSTSFKKLFFSSLKMGLNNENLPENYKINYKKALNEFSKNNGCNVIRCLVPMAIDQAPYFRMARDVAHKLGCPKPAVIHSEFLPGLKQVAGKMSSTDQENATLFLDMDASRISDIIKKYAFSGGRKTLEEHRTHGGDIKTDISYQYLLYFMDSDFELENIAKKYTSGEMTSGEIKDICSDIITKIIKEHQEYKSKLSNENVKDFFNPNRNFNIGGCYNKKLVNHEYMDYSKYGIDFDRTFGCKNN